MNTFFCLIAIILIYFFLIKGVNIKTLQNQLIKLRKISIKKKNICSLILIVSSLVLFVTIVKYASDKTTAIFLGLTLEIIIVIFIGFMFQDDTSKNN